MAEPTSEPLPGLGYGHKHPGSRMPLDAVRALQDAGATHRDVVVMGAVLALCEGWGTCTVGITVLADVAGIQRRGCNASVTRLVELGALLRWSERWRTGDERGQRAPAWLQPSPWYRDLVEAVWEAHRAPKQGTAEAHRAPKQGKVAPKRGNTEIKSKKAPSPPTREASGDSAALPPCGDWGLHRAGFCDCAIEGRAASVGTLTSGEPHE